jgi:signal transduction histidine kinase
VDTGLDRDALGEIAEGLTPAHLNAVLAWLAATHTAYALIDEIGRSAARIAEIVNTLKAYSFLDQAPVQTVDIHRGLENTLSLLNAKLGSGVVVQRQYAPDLPLVQAHGSELNQVWTNLIDNALDAMNGKGELCLRTCHDDRWVVVEVRDDGTGIPDDARGRLFDPFFTTKPPGKGAGLGLNVCHTIVVQGHKGRIDVASRPGCTAFTVRLPRGE